MALILISKDESDEMKRKKILKCVKGRYPDLTIVGRQKKSKRKRRYVPEYLYKKYIKGG